MATITVSADLSVDANTFANTLTLTAGEAIVAGDACYIEGVAGKAMKANNTHLFVGVARKAAALGAPVTLYLAGTKLTNLAAGTLTPGAPLYQAGAGDEGEFSDAPIVATDPKIAICVSTTDAIIK